MIQLVCKFLTKSPSGQLLFVVFPVAGITKPFRKEYIWDCKLTAYPKKIAIVNLMPLN